mmetsp:Transcript_52355/g.150057  ORF Transcript_52355/g.150057 Transcript_52355/m.150057 type:complete len:294 (-) Transcript_52355:969-1850(-)
MYSGAKEADGGRSNIHTISRVQSSPTAEPAKEEAAAQTHVFQGSGAESIAICNSNTALAGACAGLSSERALRAKQAESQSATSTSRQTSSPRKSSSPDADTTRQTCCNGAKAISIQFCVLPNSRAHAPRAASAAARNFQSTRKASMSMGSKGIFINSSKTVENPTKSCGSASHWAICSGEARQFFSSRMRLLFSGLVRPLSSSSSSMLSRVAAAAWVPSWTVTANLSHTAKAASASSTSVELSSFPSDTQDPTAMRRMAMADSANPCQSTAKSPRAARGQHPADKSANNGNND